jgi:hypothetical protein
MKRKKLWLKIGLFVAAVLVTAISATAYLAAEEGAQLPFDYSGFDN